MCDLVSAKIDAAASAKSELLIREIDVVRSSLGRHLGAVLTTATPLQRHINDTIMHAIRAHFITDRALARKAMQ